MWEKRIEKRFGKDEASEILAEMLDLVGLSSLTQPDEGAEAGEGAEKLLEERQVARAAKDFARADEIRDELASSRVGSAGLG